MLKNIIETWLGNEEKHWNKHSAGNYKDGAIQALADLKSRIPELEEMIVKIIENEIDENIWTEQGGIRYDTMVANKKLESIITSLKGGKE